MIAIGLGDAEEVEQGSEGGDQDWIDDVERDPNAHRKPWVDSIQKERRRRMG